MHFYFDFKIWVFKFHAIKLVGRLLKDLGQSENIGFYVFVNNFIFPAFCVASKGFLMLNVHLFVVF